MGFSLDFSAWQAWLALGIVLAIAEVLGTQFVLLALGAAFALTALVTGAFGLSFDMQLLSAAVFAALLLPAFILFYRRRMMPQATRTLVSDGLGIGETFVIISRSERLGVKIQGDFFPADSATGAVLAEGERVVVTGWRGITVIVRPAA